MATTYLSERDAKTIKTAKSILENMPNYVKDFYDAKQSAKKELTRLAYIRDIKEFLEYMSGIHKCEVKKIPVEILGELTPQDITEYKNILFSERSYKDASVKRKMASLSSFFKFLVLNGFIDKNPASIIEWPPEDKSRQIIYLSGEQTARLLKGILANDKQIYYMSDEGNVGVDKRDLSTNTKGVAKNKNTDYIVGDISSRVRKRKEAVKIRNYLITLLFLKTGIRVSELVSIDTNDINRRDYSINITGKGNKTRPVSYYEKGKDGTQIIDGILTKYLNGERKAIISKTGSKEDALFLSNRGKRITVRQVENMIKEMVQTYLDGDESIAKSDFSPHKLRSTCATRLLEQTGDIKGVSDLLGHESIEITSRRYAALVKEKNARKMGEHNLL